MGRFLKVQQWCQVMGTFMYLSRTQPASKMLQKSRLEERKGRKKVKPKRFGAFSMEHSLIKELVGAYLATTSCILNLYA